MTESDLKLYDRLVTEIRTLLPRKEKLGLSNLPMDFNGIASDMLYAEGVANDALVLLVDALLQECAGKSDREILERFMLVEKGTGDSSR